MKNLQLYCQNCLLQWQLKKLSSQKLCRNCNISLNQDCPKNSREIFLD